MVNNTTDLGRALIMEMGLSMDNDHVLYDQDTYTPISYQGKRVKYSSTDPDKLYIGEGDVLFDPVHNYHMMLSMLGYYIDKEKEAGNLDAIAPYSITAKDKTTAHGIKCEHGECVESDYYHNRCLGICDVILKRSYDDINIHQFDDEN